jgi:glycosyltransferase involved in cell wall biosynthesis
VPAEKLTLIPCGTRTDVQREVPSSLRQELCIEDETLVVGSTGIWRPNKGFTYFLSACERAHQRFPRARFLLGGRAYGQDMAFATTLWVRGQWLRAAQVLDFTGFQDDVGRFLSALDVFVLPSDCEPFGLILIEAMARGIPVVATAAGGVQEIVVHNQSGLLVPPKDPEAMSVAIEDLLSNADRRGRLGERGQVRVRRLFDQQRMLEDYMTLYTRLAQAPR